ncbi:MAG: SAM-dependent methyltransferase, partial [Clostridia bacterium]|nr:SAM-dependent methyltransferase [Clostridia bacterium]
MNRRLEEIFSVIPKCEVFADIGCDHGLMTKAMLVSGKC